MSLSIRKAWQKHKQIFTCSEEEFTLGAKSPSVVFNETGIVLLSPTFISESEGGGVKIRLKNPKFKLTASGRYLGGWHTSVLFPHSSFSHKEPKTVWYSLCLGGNTGFLTNLMKEAKFEQALMYIQDLYKTFNSHGYWWPYEKCAEYTSCKFCNAVAKASTGICRACARVIKKEDPELFKVCRDCGALKKKRTKCRYCF